MTRRTPAIIGESGTEFVLPEARLRQMVGSGRGGVSVGDIVIHAAPGQDERAIARYTISELERRVATSRRMRRSLGGAGRGSLFG